MKMFFPWGEVRRYAPPAAYVAYRQRCRIAALFAIPAVVLEVIFAPVPHAPAAVRVAIIACAVILVGVWAASSIAYVLAWDELQRRALAESGAIAFLVTLVTLTIYGYVETLFQLPHINAIIWTIFGGVVWFVTLPLVQRHYEA